jgi:hypothetical protein
VIGITDKKRLQETLKRKLDERYKPENPFIKEIKDTTHDITIIFEDPVDNGLPIKKVKFFKDNERNPFEIIDYKKEITLKTKIHKNIKLGILFENEVGESTRTEKIIKLKDCDRADFTESTKNLSLEKTKHRCTKTGIHFDSKYFICELDHKDGLRCNNSIDNCQPLLVEIHNMKTYNKDDYSKLSDKDELFNYKYERIAGIFESLSVDDKNKMLNKLRNHGTNILTSNI